MLEVKNLTVSFGSHTVVNNVSFSLGEKQWLMIVGPNGAGKSTIVNAISQGVPYRGSVYFSGKDLAGLKPSELARKVGVLSQRRFVSYSFTVEEVVRLGRYAYSSSIFSGRSDDDEAKIEEALEVTGMKPFRGKSVLTLSGGELQRTFLAQVFAQDPRLLILDEPMNHLDLVYQKQMLELIRRWVGENGRAVISVMHDLNHAWAYGTDALLLDKGRVVAWGKTADVLTNENLQSVYSMDVYDWMRSLLSRWSR